jgi:hypothetical protein
MGRPQHCFQASRLFQLRTRSISARFSYPAPPCSCAQLRMTAADTHATPDPQESRPAPDGPTPCEAQREIQLGPHSIGIGKSPQKPHAMRSAFLPNSGKERVPPGGIRPRGLVAIANFRVCIARPHRVRAAGHLVDPLSPGEDLTLTPTDGNVSISPAPTKSKIFRMTIVVCSYFLSQPRVAIANFFGHRDSSFFLWTKIKLGTIRIFRGFVTAPQPRACGRGMSRSTRYSAALQPPANLTAACTSPGPSEGVPGGSRAGCRPPRNPRRSRARLVLLRDRNEDFAARTSPERGKVFAWELGGGPRCYFSSSALRKPSPQTPGASASARLR